MPGSVGTLARTMPVLLLTAFILFADGRNIMAASEIQGDLALVGGYRIDALDWNIAGDRNGENPNILSELTWKDLKIYHFGVVGTAEKIDPVFMTFSPCVRVALGYGEIVSGKNQDSDYNGDNRTLEFSRTNNAADSGSVFDLSLAGGGKFHFRDNRYTIAPLLGFSYYTQNLTMRDGYQTISDYTQSPDIPPPGPFSGLSSTYEAAWYGPWAGGIATAVPVPGWTISTGIELHQVYYHADADWNLRTDLEHPKSFEQDGSGYGLIFRLGTSYALTSRLELTLDGDLRSFAIHDGTDRTFYADGGKSTTRLNEVNWESKQLTAGVLYHF